MPNDPMKNADPTDKGRLCGARKKKGGHCCKTSGWGTNHAGTGRCKLHGGSSPRAEVAGQVLLARREAAVMGIPLDIEPHDAILQCIQIAAGEVAYASGQIAELEAHQAAGPAVTKLDRPLKEEKGAESTQNRAEEITEGKPELHIWIVTRHGAMDRLVQYSVAAIKAGVEERRVKLAEQQGQLLAQAIKGILEDLGVDKRPEVPSVVRRHLSLVATAA